MSAEIMHSQIPQQLLSAFNWMPVSGVPKMSLGKTADASLVPNQLPKQQIADFKPRVPAIMGGDWLLLPKVPQCLPTVLLGGSPISTWH